MGMNATHTQTTVDGVPRWTMKFGGEPVLEMTWFHIEVAPADLETKREFVLVIERGKHRRCVETSDDASSLFNKAKQLVEAQCQDDNILDALFEIGTERDVRSLTRAIGFMTGQL